MDVDVTGSSVVLPLPPPKNFLIPLKKPDFFVVASRGFSDVGSSPSSYVKYNKTSFQTIQNAKTCTYDT